MHTTHSLSHYLSPDIPSVPPFLLFLSSFFQTWKTWRWFCSGREVNSFHHNFHLISYSRIVSHLFSLISLFHSSFCKLGIRFLFSWNISRNHMHPASLFTWFHPFLVLVITRFTFTFIRANILEKMHLPLHSLIWWWIQTREIKDWVVEEVEKREKFKRTSLGLSFLFSLLWAWNMRDSLSSTHTRFHLQNIIIIITRAWTCNFTPFPDPFVSLYPSSVCKVCCITLKFPPPLLRFSFQNLVIVHKEYKG